MRISDWSSDVCSSDLTPTVVKVKPKPLFGAAGKPIKPQDIASFSRMIATMIKSGVPVVQALEIIGSGNKNPRMQKLVGSIRSDIENGSSIYDAPSKNPVKFEELYRKLVRDGESGGGDRKGRGQGKSGVKREDSRG